MNPLGNRVQAETLSQIDEVRRGEVPSLSLRRASLNVGLHFTQCARCKGCGYTSAMLLLTTHQIETLAAAGCGDPVPIQYERCPECRGDGGFIEVP
jgi:hypothetical protein